MTSSGMEYESVVLAPLSLSVYVRLASSSFLSIGGHRWPS